MRWPIYLLGFLMLGLGGSIVINPEILKKLIDVIDGIRWRLYSIGVFRFTLGILFILSAENSRLYGFILTLGILMILGGVTIFAVPHHTLIKMLAWYRDRSLLTCRIIGIAALILASVLIFAC